jgi:hypothetical protein
MLLTKKMPSFDGVAAGQTATAKLPIGLSYHLLQLTYSGATLAQLNEVRLLINGAVHQRWVEATLLDLVNQFDAASAAAGVLMIPVGDRFGLLTRAGIEFTKLGTGVLDDPNPITSLSLEIDIDAAAVAPVLTLHALQSDPDYSGRVKHIQRRVYNPAAAGEFQISDINVQGREIGRIIIDESAITLSAAVVEKNGFIAFDRTSAVNEKLQTDGVRVPQAGLWVIDWAEQGYGTEAIDTVDAQDLRLRLTVSGAGALPVIIESYGKILG